MAPSLRRREPAATLEQVAAVEAKLTETLEVLHGEVATNDFLQESLAALEMQLDEIGWQRLSLESDWEFSRDGLDRIVALSRLNALKNPLIRRGVHLKADYVFGQGVEIAARDAQINELVLQPFLDDPANAKTLTSDVSLPAKDRALTTDGNLVLVLFPNLLTGHVSVRSIDVIEIRDIVTNPNDAAETWFYLRRWTERRPVLDGIAGGFNTVAREAWYPDWRYQPAAGTKVESIDGVIVRWDSPIYHAKVGGLDQMRFGLPETYAALDWAKAYKLFLEDWATIVRSLSRFAWELTVKKNPGSAARRLGAQAAAGQQERNPSPVAGATLTATEGTSLKALPKSDATIASADGVWLAKMVGAALGLPYTILMGDPDMGNLATAKTLDRPTELAMEGRQRIWAEILRDISSFCIDWAIRAPGGPLTGAQERGPDGRMRWVLDDETVDGETVTGADRRTVDVTFPPITAEDILDRIKAVVLADGTEYIDEAVILRLLLTALGVDDVDELVAQLPDRLEARKAEAGQMAIDQFRQGHDPAAVIDPPGDE